MQPAMKMSATLPPLLYLLIFLCLSSSFTRKVAAQNMTMCIEKERQALLDLKHGLVDTYGFLSSWGSDDVDQRECCNWRGVQCNNNTGHVITLDLASLDLIGIKGSIPDAFGDMEFLESLHLDFNYFTNGIPKSFGNLTHLQNLYLRNNQLNESITEFFGKLSKGGARKSLQRLDLSLNKLNGELPTDIGTRFPSLKELVASNNKLNGSLFTLPSTLQRLDLFSNNIRGFLDIKCFGQECDLVELYLSNNQITGQFPTDMGTRFPSLKLLSASDNELNESLFTLPSTLQSLDLSNNKIRGFQDMKCFGQECDLVDLDLSNNQIKGQFPDLSPFSSLQRLDLSRNQITGQIPDLSPFSSLQTLDLSRNQIRGQLPDLSNLSSLQDLFLYENQIQGGLPKTLGKLSKLLTLDASFNSLEGVLTETHFSNLTDLSTLYLSYNVALSFNLSGNWIPPFQLYVLYCVNCKMGPQFPKWIQNQTHLSSIDISYGNISDTIPEWFWNNSTRREYMNLSYNQISGKLPNLSRIVPNSQSFLGSEDFLILTTIDLSNNNFWGPIPPFLKDFSIIHLSNNKFVGPISIFCSFISEYTFSIDLSYNHLFGEIPNCWNKSSNLFILNLGNNYFSGKVPHTLGSISQLQSLHLRNNHLTGKLPSSLHNCKTLKVLDLGSNEFTGKIPSWIGGSLTNLVIVSLRHNKFYGGIPSSICHPNNIQILDLSGNKLTGEIPHCFNNFTHLVQINSNVELQKNFNFTINGNSAVYIDNVVLQWKNKVWEYRKQLGLLKSIDFSNNQLIGDIPEEFSALKGLLSLNLSNNYLTGEIFSTIYQMKSLEVLDMSSNHLSGAIPIGLASLNYLAVLDLSNNSLSGKIPTGTQLQSFNASSYAGNSGLCGDPLPKCSPDAPPQNTNNEYQEGDNFLDREFYISMVLGFSLSFWGFVITLVLKRSWRLAYYAFLNGVNDWLYVKINIYLAMLQRKFRRT